MKQVFVIAGFAAALCAPGANANAQEALQWSVTPYLWASDTTVDLTIRDTNIGGDDISFDDLLDVLDAAFMVHVEAGRSNWSAFLDITYLSTSDTTERPLATIDVDSEQTIIDAAVTYWPGGIDTPLGLFGGVRYTSFDDRYRFSLGGTEIGTQRSGDDYYDVLLGARYTFGLSDRWSIVTHGDLSFGDSEGTYLLRANFAYSVGKQKQNNILFGYQFKSAEFKDGDVRTDFTYGGPMAGFNFRF
ncbi:MAG: hypothetical protein P8X98_06845 [Woeseiaceae bacterium]|jgi:hypothetical protein